MKSENIIKENSVILSIIQVYIIHVSNVIIDMLIVSRTNVQHQISVENIFFNKKKQEDRNEIGAMHFFRWNLLG